jgi:hypothetical protein
LYELIYGELPFVPNGPITLKMAIEKKNIKDISDLPAYPDSP